MFRRISGKPVVNYLPKTASTVFLPGALTRVVSGQLLPASATSTIHFGVMLRDVKAADADFAATTMVPVDIGQPGDIFEADVDGGGLVAADVGVRVNLNATGDAINRAATSVGPVTVVGRISATKALVMINSLASSRPSAT